ncbi:MAG: ABC transporter permease [Bacteroidota bacterium]
MKHNQTKDAPPLWMLRLLKFIRPDILERVEGDILETYDRRLKSHGPFTAKRLFIRDIVSMMRPFALKRQPTSYRINTFDMLSNYLKLTLRNITSNVLTSFINIFGLSVSIACCIVLFVFVNIILSANDFIEKGDSIYMAVSHSVDKNRDAFLWGRSPELLGPSVAEDMGAVENFSRYVKGSAIVRADDVVLEEPVQYVDQGFLEMFSFDLAYGNAQALYNAQQVVLSDNAAKKFFGNDNPIGREISLKANGRLTIFEVGAVAQKFPNNAYFDFNILVPYEALGRTEESWSNLVHATFFETADPDALNALNGKQNEYTQAYNAKDPVYPINRLSFTRFDKLTTGEQYIKSSVVGKENPTTLIGAIFFGVLLLSLSCINYVNIALASVSKRLKEIGLRKSIGATRKQLIFQFLSQNIILCFLAVFLGLGLAQFIIAPLFDSFFPVDFVIDYGDSVLWIFLLATAVVTGLLSGLYPALYVSSFNATLILKGTERFGSSRNYLFKFFLGIQFAFTFLIIFSGISFVSNSEFQRNIDWGYNESGLVVVPLSDSNQYNALYDRVSRYPEVQAVAGSQHHVGRRSTTVDIVTLDGKDPILTYAIDSAYMNAMGMRIVKGEFFGDVSNRRDALVVNESFAKKFLIGEVPGSYLKTADGEYEIIGVVEDFHYRDFYASIEAMAFKLMEQPTFNYMVIRTDVGQMSVLNDKLKSEWAQLFPDAPYNVFYQDESFDEFFRQMSIPTNILITYAIISIILSSMGLFGLVSIVVERKMKEIGIRKVLGASIVNLSMLVQKQFVLILLIALIIAIPFSQQLVSGYLDDVNAFHVPVGVKLISFSVLILVCTVLLTISSNLIKVSKTNPTETLRQD